MKRFIEEDIAVLCETKEELKAFLEICKKEELELVGGLKPTDLIGIFISEILAKRPVCIYYIHGQLWWSYVKWVPGSFKIIKYKDYFEEVKGVIRPAKPGEYIKLIETKYSFDKIGDILKVSRVSPAFAKVLNKDLPNKQVGYHDEFEFFYNPDCYVVLENYVPKEKKKNLSSITKDEFIKKSAEIISKLADKLFGEDNE